MHSETILQFGAGNFLRAFADRFVHQANEQGQDIGRIVVVQSTGDARAQRLNDRGGKYHVVIRGLQDGQVIDRVEECASISRALVAATQWNDVLKVAQSKDLRFILSNTTEAGYNLDENDRSTSAPPNSFPAKLLMVLLERWKADLAGVTIMPCELHEDNAIKLQAIVLNLCRKWELGSEFQKWLVESCVWLCSLVDCIVPGTPDGHPILETDPLAIMAEPFAFWALEDHPLARPWVKHSAIVRTRDVKPYFLRKVRILNGAHTALLCHVGLNQFKTVLEAINDPATLGWLEELLFEEIVPVMEGRCEDAQGFAQQTLERFRNPFLKHKLADIALHHQMKKTIRLEPTLREFTEKYKKEPPKLSAALRNDRVVT